MSGDEAHLGCSGRAGKGGGHAQDVEARRLADAAGMSRARQTASAVGVMAAAVAMEEGEEPAADAGPRCWRYWEGCTQNSGRSS